MFKVKEEKLIADYQALVAKQVEGSVAGEARARALAAELHYNERQTQDLIEHIRKEYKGGLSVIDLHKLEHLAEYIEEVADVHESELKEAYEASDPNAQNPFVV